MTLKLAAPHDGDLLVAVAREGQLLVAANGLCMRGGSSLSGATGQFAQCTEDGLARAKISAFWNERAVQRTHGHGELGGHDGAHQDRLAGARGQGQM